MLDFVKRLRDHTFTICTNCTNCLIQVKRRTPCSL